MEVIRLKHTWCGHPEGTIVKITDTSANDLFQKDAAEKMEPENNVSIKDKLQRMVAQRRVKTGDTSRPGDDHPEDPGTQGNQ